MIYQLHTWLPSRCAQLLAVDFWGGSGADAKMCEGRTRKSAQGTELFSDLTSDSEVRYIQSPRNSFKGFGIFILLPDAGNTRI